MTVLGYAHHGGGGGLVGYIAHALVWAAVSRVMWHVPLGLVLVVAALAAVVIVRRRRRV